MKKLITLLVIMVSVASYGQVDTAWNSKQVRSAINAALAALPPAQGNTDLSPVYKYADSLFNVINGSIESIVYKTKNATGTAAFNMDTLPALPTNSLVRYTINVSARNLTNQDAAGWNYMVELQNKNGVTTVTRSLLNDSFKPTSLSAANVSFAIVGGQCVIRATSITGNVEWKTSYFKTL